MKIYVYAICKNEEKFVRRWMKSMSEADGVFVADTGSSDDSVKIERAWRNSERNQNQSVEI